MKIQAKDESTITILYAIPYNELSVIKSTSCCAKMCCLPYGCETPCTIVPLCLMMFDCLPFYFREATGSLVY